MRAPDRATLLEGGAAYSVAPVSALGQELAEVLAGVLDVPEVAADAHFFEDLGADSMRMALFCSRVRKRPHLPSVSMKDIYTFPTLRALAAALPAPAVPPVLPSPALPAAGTSKDAPPLAAVGPAPAGDDLAGPLVLAPPRPATAGQRRLCAVAQLVAILMPICLLGLVGLIGYRWIEPTVGLTDHYLRTVAFLTAVLLAAFALPIAAKWVLVGRWKPAEFAVWTPRYFRLWLVKTMVMRNPLVALMVGSPLYPVYLRLLGAKIGPGTTILTKQFPICTDLFTVGADTVIRKDAILTGYQVEAGVVRIGPVTIGSRAIVGEQAVLDIDTAIGDDGQLGHASSLHPGQSVPPGERWHGSPGQPGAPDFTTVLPTYCTSGHRGRFAVFQVVTHLLVSLPLATAIGVGVLVLTENLAGVRHWGQGSLFSVDFVLSALWAAFVLYFGGALLGLPVQIGTARLLDRALQRTRTYRLFGFHHLVLRALTGMTNRKFYMRVTGDSSAVVHYLRWLGYRLAPYVQTGTNFGIGIKHDNPLAVHIGTGTVVADGLSTLSAEYSASSFRIRPVRIGRDNFIGNNVAYPAGGRTGDDCLLATKVMVPVDGELRSGVGLLGSPAFEIPRLVARDAGFAADAATLRRDLRAKNRHNTVTVALQMLARWFFVFGLLLYAEGSTELYKQIGPAALVLCSALLFAFTTGYWLAVARAVNPLVALAPDGMSVYDRAFWRHERYWKVPSLAIYKIFPGTPFQGAIWRAAGVRVGRNLFDEGADIVERPFTTIGDDVTLNVGTAIQPHSQEDGAFKSDHIRIGNGVTVGVGAWVHYGADVGDGVVLQADSFLMKGEQVPPHSRWGGNPAGELVRGTSSTAADFTGARGFV